MEPRKVRLFDDSDSFNPALQYAASPNIPPNNQADWLLHVVGGQYKSLPHASTGSSTTSSQVAASSTSRNMPPKRQSGSPPPGYPAKIPKTEQKPEDFSNSVKKRLQSSTRTGQACDRCKVCAHSFTSDFCRELTMEFKSDSIDTSLGPQDSLRCPPRRMLSLYRKSDTMSNYRSHYWPRRPKRIL